MKEKIEEIASYFSPNFYADLSNKLIQKDKITIFDIGFFAGGFTKEIVENIRNLDTNKSIEIYSFDPIKNIKRDKINNFLKKNDVKWQHFDIAVGNKNSVEDFSVLKHFPASGSSINNILENSFWLKTRRYLLFPFTKASDFIQTLIVDQKKLDSLNIYIDKLDLLKIDVEGYALPVLQGGIEIIKKHSPIIQLEILSKKKEFKNSENEIFKFMNNLKYEETARKKHYTTHIFSDVVCVDYLFERRD